MADWKHNPVIAIGAAVLLVLAVVFIAMWLIGPKTSYSLKCESCGTEFQAKLPKEQVFPVACPSCGKNTAYKVIQMICKACGKTFARIDKPGTVSADNMASSQGAATAIKCPHCGAQGNFEKVK